MDITADYHTITAKHCRHSRPLVRSTLFIASTIGHIWLHSSTPLPHHSFDWELKTNNDSIYWPACRRKPPRGDCATSTWISSRVLSMLSSPRGIIFCYLAFGIWIFGLLATELKVLATQSFKCVVMRVTMRQRRAMTTTMTQPPKSQKKKEPKAKANKQPFQSTFDHWHWRADTAYSSTSTP